MSSKPTPGPKLEWRLTPYFDRHGRVDPHRFQSIVLAKVDQQFGCEGVILTTGYKGAEVDDIWVGASPDHVSLILEAGTIFEQTGLTPQQLREQRDKLLAQLKDAVRSTRKDFKGGADGDRQHREAYADWFAAIASVEAKS